MVGKTSIPFGHLTPKWDSNHQTGCCAQPVYWFNYQMGLKPPNPCLVPNLFNGLLIKIQRPVHLLTLLTFSKIAKNACVFSLKFGSLSSVSDFFRLHGPSVNFSLENGFFLLEPVEFRITFVLSWRTPETFVSSENERFCESLFLFLWIFITSEGLFHFGELLDIVRRWNSRVNYTGSEIK